MTRQDLLDELLVERHRPVPCRPQDRIQPLTIAEQRHHARVLDHEVAVFEEEARSR